MEEEKESEKILLQIKQQKIQLRELTDKLYRVIGGVEHMSFYFQYPDYTRKKFIKVITNILDFLRNHKILLSYNSQTITIDDWYDEYNYRDDKTVFELYERYLKSEYISSLPKGDFMHEISYYHFKAIRKLNESILLIDEF